MLGRDLSRIGRLNVGNVVAAGVKRTSGWLTGEGVAS